MLQACYQIHFGREIGISDGDESRALLLRTAHVTEAANPQAPATTEPRHRGPTVWTSTPAKWRNLAFDPLLLQWFVFCPLQLPLTWGYCLSSSYLSVHSSIHSFTTTNKRVKCFLPSSVTSSSKSPSATMYASSSLWNKRMTLPPLGKKNQEYPSPPVTTRPSERSSGPATNVRAR